MKITALTTHDVRFPTSRSLDGSDAMHRSPDYSAAYVVLHTDDPALSGHGLTFTNGRGTEVCVAAIRALEPLVVGRTLEGITGDMRGFWRSLVSEDQLRWLGPEKGVIHLVDGRGRQRGLGSVGEDARRAGLAAPRRSVAGGDRVGRSTSATSRTRSRRTRRSTCCATAAPGRDERERELARAGYPAYTTSAGWLGYDDEKVEQLVARGARRRLPPREDEGRRDLGVGRPPGRPDPRRARRLPAR